MAFSLIFPWLWNWFLWPDPEICSCV